MALRMCLLVGSLLVFFYAFAEDEAKPRTQAVSKEVYDLLTEAHSAAKHLESLGIDLESVRPENLPFPSRDINECFWLASAQSQGQDEFAIAIYSCFLRHPPSVKNEDTE